MIGSIQVQSLSLSLFFSYYILLSPPYTPISPLVTCPLLSKGAIISLSLLLYSLITYSLLLLPILSSSNMFSPSYTLFSYNLLSSRIPSRGQEEWVPDHVYALLSYPGAEIHNTGYYRISSVTLNCCA